MTIEGLVYRTTIRCLDKKWRSNPLLLSGIVPVELWTEKSSPTGKTVLYLPHNRLVYPLRGDYKTLVAAEGYARQSLQKVFKYKTLP